MVASVSNSVVVARAFLGVSVLKVHYSLNVAESMRERNGINIVRFVSGSGALVISGAWR
jgi:hypothetical protein